MQYQQSGSPSFNTSPHVSLRAVLEHSNVTSLAWSSDSRMLAVASSHNIWLHNLERSNKPSLLEGHLGLVSKVVFSRNGTFFASTSHDGTVRLWNSLSGELRAILPMSGYQLQSIDISPDGTLIAVGGSEDSLNYWARGALTLFDVETENRLISINTERSISDILFHPEKKVVSRVIRGPIIHDIGRGVLSHQDALIKRADFAHLCVREN